MRNRISALLLTALILLPAAAGARTTPASTPGIHAVAAAATAPRVRGFEWHPGPAATCPICAAGIARRIVEELGPIGRRTDAEISSYIRNGGNTELRLDYFKSQLPRVDLREAEAAFTRNQQLAEAWPRDPDLAIVALRAEGDIYSVSYRGRDLYSGSDIDAVADTVKALERPSIYVTFDGMSPIKADAFAFSLRESLKSKRFAGNVNLFTSRAATTRAEFFSHRGPWELAEISPVETVGFSGTEALLFRGRYVGGARQLAIVESPTFGERVLTFVSNKREALGVAVAKFKNLFAGKAQPRPLYQIVEASKAAARKSYPNANVDVMYGAEFGGQHLVDFHVPAGPATSLHAATGSVRRGTYGDAR